MEHDEKKTLNEIESIVLNNNIIRYRANNIYLNKDIVWAYKSDNTPKEYEIISFEKVLSKLRWNNIL
ncbi:hypothetical protein AGMMS50255_3580 [Spirochaetia bacterium]|nr:hypothetical protein AGMMS50255_3580 [Spirochaetia bacterium]